MTNPRSTVKSGIIALAGLLPTPAEIPPESELAKAAALFADKLTVRQVSEAMKISVGKAHALKVKAAIFDVHVHLNVNKPRAPAGGIGHNSKRASVMPCADAWQAITAARTEHEARVEAEKEAARIKRRAEQAARDKRNAEIDADPLTIPAHLRRQPSLSRRADV